MINLHSLSGDNPSVPEEERPVYEVWRVRRLCEEIAIEQDNEKAEDLIKLLSAVIREKDEEIVFNLTVLRSKSTTAIVLRCPPDV